MGDNLVIKRHKRRPDFMSSRVRETGLSDLDFPGFGRGSAGPAPSLTPWHLLQRFCCLRGNLVFKVSHLACRNSLAVRHSQCKQPTDNFHRIKLYLPGDQGEILCTNPERVGVPPAVVCPDCLRNSRPSACTVEENTVETGFLTDLLFLKACLVFF